MSDYFTKQGEGTVGTVHTVEDALKAHHLATADPESDGTMTGPAHEEKYGLERAADSAAAWRAQGVHPTENRALREGEDGAENLRGAAAVETTQAPKASETTAAPRASSS